MNPRRCAILREMGLAPLWRLRAPAETVDADAGIPELPPEETPGPDDGHQRSSELAPPADASRVVAMDWQELEETIRTCRACALCEKRTQAVPGVGDRQARWMFVGEGPGAEEDRRGEPFVGQAGRLLDHMLAALNLKRGEDVYIANAVKCRPPLNRTPGVAEIAACAPFLERQIALVRPRLLIALGRPAAQALLGQEISIAAARGKRFEREGVPVIVTYHPAYLLRNPSDKGKAWEDLCFARRLVAEGA
ncbi:MAG: uracil-DNA glycosylase [Azoarcus sp.]|jgi:DNA polymerase|nr:uracil-DNA glycosylase [Azoarcus sp.]